MKYLMLFVLLPILALAANPRDRYRICLDGTNKLESPADRDSKKIECYRNGQARKSVPLCLNLARVLEHTTAADSLIMECLADNVLRIKFEDCVSTSKKLHYAESRDKALFMCMENHPIRSSRCRGFSEEMTYPHNKAVAYQHCMMKN